MYPRPRHDRVAHRAHLSDRDVSARATAVPGAQSSLCNDALVSQADTSSSSSRSLKSDDQSRLLERVRRSTRSIAVYDIATPAILAASPVALEQLGFAGVELAEVDIVGRARDPDSTRRLLALIRDGELKDWKVRTWLRTSDREGCWDYARGQAIDVEGRRLGVVSYPAPGEAGSNAALSSLDEVVVDRDADQEVPAVALSATLDRLSSRVAELEGHLRRIVGEVQAAGIAAAFPGDAMPLSTERLENLSPRELDIVSRMLRGERVPTIARSLHLSASTVRNHLSKIYRKVGVHSQVELIEVLQDRNGQRR